MSTTKCVAEKDAEELDTEELDIEIDFELAPPPPDEKDTRIADLEMALRKIVSARPHNTPQSNMAAWLARIQSTAREALNREALIRAKIAGII